VRGDSPPDRKGEREAKDSGFIRTNSPNRTIIQEIETPLQITEGLLMVADGLVTCSHRCRLTYKFGVSN